VQDYLREEVLAEGLTRNLPIFSDFLRVAAIGDTEIVSYSNIARESSIKMSNVRDHYGILVDTLLGAFLPAFVFRPKRRTIHAPKFYFRDIGVVNFLSRRGDVRIGSELFGKAFENVVFHELSVHSRYSGLFYELSYWRLSSGIEVDFILDTGTIAIEVKGKSLITSADLKGLQHFKKDYPHVKHLLVVSLEPKTRKTAEGIWIFPFGEFLQKLWDGAWTTL
jgi:predicted AAA+ superfamily ATPase